MQLDVQGDDMLFVTSNGMGKRTELSEFTAQMRGGKGVKCYKITDKTGDIVSAKAVTNDHDIMMMTNEGIMIRMHCSDITVIGRITSGVKLMNIGKDGSSFVASVAKLARSEESEDGQDEEADDVTATADENVEETAVDEDDAAEDQSGEDIEKDAESADSEE